MSRVPRLPHHQPNEKVPRFRAISRDESGAPPSRAISRTH